MQSDAELINIWFNYPDEWRKLSTKEKTRITDLLEGYYGKND